MSLIARRFIGMTVLLVAWASTAQSGSITVVKAWSRATAPGITVGAAYFEIVNVGAADTLTALESPIARQVEMHTMSMTGGMMQMRQISVLNVPSGSRVAFSPGGLHAMLTGLTAPLTAGAHVPLMLVFKNAGRISVDAIVQGLDGAEPAAAAMDTKPRAADHFRLAVWPQHAQSPDFALVDVDGHSRTLADYRGAVVVLFFGFLRCPDACPAELFKLALVMKQLGGRAAHVRVLFVTLDPERDTRPLLKGYVARFDPRFTGLTGTTAQVDRAAAHFYVEYARVGTGTDYTIDHSTSSFLIDADGRLRLVGSSNTSVGDYSHDIALLADGKN